MRKPSPVAITGYALCNGLGRDRNAVRDALAEGRRGLTPCPLTLPFETTTGTMNIDFDDLEGQLAPWSTQTTRLAQYLVRGVSEPLAKLRSRRKAERIAVILGTTTSGADATEAAYRRYLSDGALPESYDLWQHHTYGALLYVVRQLTGARGPSFVVSTACTASAKPIASAQRMIDADMIDAAIVGGLDTLCTMTLRGFHALEALSSAPSRPFSAERDGLNIGEGGALLLLERDGDALALVESVGESSDAYHITAPHPEGAGAVVAMERALAQAGCTAADVDYINAHGTGTRLNDVAEAIAIEKLFGSDVPVVSTKGYTGHTLGAAGATEAAMGVIALEEQWVPGSVGADPLDPKVRVNVPLAKTSLAIRRVLSNSFAFGGNNTSVLLRSV